MPRDGKSRRRRSRSWFRRDNRRALAICLLFGGAAAFGLGSVIQQHAPFTSIRIAANGPGFTNGDDDLATGAIIFVPILGNTCRKKLIDNATWQIRDSGLVDCRTALAQGAYGNQLGWSTSRVDVIRNGFYSR